MTGPARHALRAGALSLVLLALSARASDLEAVMGLLALHRHGHVEFVEQHFIAMLDHPIESQGEMRFDAPDHLEKRTLKPHLESLILNGDELTVERGGKRRVLDLKAYPQVEPFIESIRATLAGDQASLAKNFKLEFAGSVARWTLTLVPIQQKVKQTVAQVRIDGIRDQLSKVEIRQPDGDRSLMTLRPATTP